MEPAPRRPTLTSSSSASAGRRARARTVKARRWAASLIVLAELAVAVGVSVGSGRGRPAGGGRGASGLEPPGLEPPGRRHQGAGRASRQIHRRGQRRPADPLPGLGSGAPARRRTHYAFALRSRRSSPYIMGADLPLCHVETPMTPAPPTGFPVFNTPPALAPDRWAWIERARVPAAC